METKDILIKKLEQMGGKYWAKGAMERMYFPASIVFQLDINYYKSHRISSATAGGERISNSEAYRCLETKVYVDLTSEPPCVATNNADRLHRYTRSLLDEFVAQLTRIIEETKEKGE